jgi:hypothetical protein
MKIIIGMLACTAAYRAFILIRKKMTRPRDDHPGEAQEKGRAEDRVAISAAILGLVAIPIAGMVVVSYGMGMAMSAGATVSNHAEVLVRIVIYVPGFLGCVALARARSKWALILGLLCIVPYFLPGLQKNLGL